MKRPLPPSHPGFPRRRPPSVSTVPPVLSTALACSLIVPPAPPPPQSPPVPPVPPCPPAAPVPPCSTGATWARRRSAGTGRARVARRARVSRGSEESGRSRRPESAVVATFPDRLVRGTRRQRAPHHELDRAAAGAAGASRTGVSPAPPPPPGPPLPPSRRCRRPRLRRWRPWRRHRRHRRLRRRPGATRVAARAAAAPASAASTAPAGNVTPRARIEPRSSRRYRFPRCRRSSHIAEAAGGARGPRDSVRADAARPRAARTARAAGTDVGHHGRRSASPCGASAPAPSSCSRCRLPPATPVVPAAGVAGSVESAPVRAGRSRGARTGPAAGAGSAG